MRSKYNKRKKRSCLGRIMTSVVVSAFAVAVTAGAYLGYAKYQGEDVGEAKDEIVQSAMMVYQQGKMIFKSGLDSLGSIFKVEGTTGWQNDHVKKQIEEKEIVDPGTIPDTIPQSQKAKEYFELINNLDSILDNDVFSEYKDSGVVCTNDVMSYNAFFLKGDKLYVDLDMATSRDGKYKIKSAIYALRLVINEKRAPINSYEELLSVAKEADNIYLDDIMYYHDKYGENEEETAELYYNNCLKNNHEVLQRLQNEGYEISYEKGMAYSEFTQVLYAECKIKAENKITGDTKYVYINQTAENMTFEDLENGVSPDDYSVKAKDYYCFETDELYSEFAKAQKAGNDYLQQNSLAVGANYSKSPKTRYYLDADYNIIEVIQ